MTPVNNSAYQNVPENYSLKTIRSINLITKYLIGFTFSWDEHTIFNVLWPRLSRIVTTDDVFDNNIKLSQLHKYDSTKLKLKHDKYDCN